MKRTLVRLGLTALISSALFGCGGGGSGGDTVIVTPGPIQTVTTTGPGIKPALLTAAQWKSLEVKGTINGITTDSPPVVTFTLTDAQGNGITGLESMTVDTTKNAGSTAKFATYPNFGFTIAKLVPGTNGSPSRWVSYEVLGTPSTTADATLGRPGTESYGTLTAVDGVPGQYKYKFYRDPKTVKSVVDAVADTATNKKADLDDLTYDASLTHRVGIQFSGAARGTGTNTPNGLTLGVDSVPLNQPVNFFYDYIPATGKQVTATDTQREIVSTAACLECHSKFVGFHGGNAVNKLPASRQETKMCVLCHTDQRKFGRTEAVTTSTGYSGDVYRVDGQSTINMTPFVHKLHMGEKLTKTGTLMAGLLANDIIYPQPVTNCVKCHDGTAGAKNYTLQGDNWKTKPSRQACGSCHDKVNFATGDHHPAPGGIQTDDSKCTTCHDAASISKVAHVSVDPVGSVDRGGYPAPANNVGNAIALASMANPPAGVFKIKFEIASVTVDTANKATVKYRILKDGTPVTLRASGFLIDDVDGTPSIYVTYGLPQDGVTKVVDWTASVSASAMAFRDAQTAGNVSALYSQTGPDTSGYYSATFKTALPTGAAMVYGAMGINYAGLVQLKGYKTIVNGVSTDVPIRLRESAFALTPAKPFVSANNPGDVRRPIVSEATCNSCHSQLGVEPSFHSGARNNPEGCALGGCHFETKATSHSDGGAWALSAKYMVHGIHGGWKRTVPFTYEASAGNPKGFGEIEYPGVLQNCRQCHVPGSYDYSNAANVNAVPGMLWTTDAALDMRLKANGGTQAADPTTWIGVSPWIIGGKFASNKALPTVLDRTILPLANGGYNDYRIDNVVSSPIASSCFGCHDAPKSVNHMEQMGGVLVKQISTVTGIAAPSTAGMTSTQIAAALTAHRANLTAVNKEACLICHGSGKTADIKMVHGVK
jgi:OmcA/MtrC family decaheme c-type cytochrome